MAFQFTRNGDVTIEVRPALEQVREADGLFYLPVEVTNRGGPTALDVQVRVTSGSETVEVVLDVLPGGGSDSVVLVFRARPEQVDAHVVSFRRR